MHDLIRSFQETKDEKSQPRKERFCDTVVGAVVCSGASGFPRPEDID